MGILILLLPLLVPALQVSAQNQKNILLASTAVDTAMTGLKALEMLPAQEWRFHMGDITHGEAVALNDSTWEVVRADSWAPEGAVWYRRWIEVPPTLSGYDLTGARIWFQFRVQADGPVPEMVYFDGRRVAMGDDLEPIVLFDSVKPGEKVLLAVKVLSTNARKQFVGADLEIDVSKGRPSPSVLLREIQGAWAMAPSLGTRSRAVQEVVEKAARSVNLDALRQRDQQAFDASLEKAHALLAEVKPDLQTMSVQLTGNAHIDAAWLWPWTETVDVVRRTFSTALQLMKEYPQYTLTQSSAAYYEWMYEKYPALFQEIAQRVKEGRWETIGGMWVEPDLNMPDGESLVRQLLVGTRYFKEKFGTDIRIGWNPDSFGYSWQLPQIYKRSGIDYFVTTKMTTWNDTNALPLRLFWWQSPDGSRILTYFPHAFVNGIEPTRIASDFATARALNPGLSEMLHLFGVGDHGGGPTRFMLESGLRWTDPERVFPKMPFGTVEQFFSSLQSKLSSQEAAVWNYKVVASGRAQLPKPSEGEVSLPVWNDELYLEYHRGIFTTQANHKRNMRESEERVLNAEKYSSLAWLYGAPYPVCQLTEAWKKALFNQAHDLAAGSGTGVLYQDAQRDYDVVRWTTEEETGKALRTIAARANTMATTGGVPVMVVNPLAWERKDIVTFNVQMPTTPKAGLEVLDSQGNPLPFQILSRDAATNDYRLLVEIKSIPSLGYEILHVIAAGRPAETDLKVPLETNLKVSGLVLENALLRVIIDSQTGCITSLYDKRSHFESIAAGGCGNELIAFKDTPKQYDAWNIDADFEKAFTKLDQADSVKLVEQGPLRATIRVVRTWSHSKFVQDISLYAGLDRVDVTNSIDWHETHVLLKAVFPLAAYSSDATYEIPYGSIERPTTRNNSWEAARFEVPALRWADLGDGRHGFSLINDSKYGYDAKGNVLRLSLLRSPIWPDLEADRGHHQFSYALYPHSGDWKQALTLRRGYEFNYRLYGMQVEAHEGRLPTKHSFVLVRGDNVVLTALKKAEDSNALLLRFYEWMGKSGSIGIQVPPGATMATTTNLMEKPEGTPLSVTNNQVTISVRPYQIISVRFDYRRTQ